MFRKNGDVQTGGQYVTITKQGEVKKDAAPAPVAVPTASSCQVCGQPSTTYAHCNVKK